MRFIIASSVGGRLCVNFVLFCCLLSTERYALSVSRCCCFIFLMYIMVPIIIEKETTKMSVIII